MRSVLEYDSYSSIITNLGFDSVRMYEEADAKVDPELYEKLKLGNLEFYRQLMENNEQISVRFSGYRKNKKVRSDELFVLFDTVELVYPVERVWFSGEPDAEFLLDKEYKVFISEIVEEENLVILSDNRGSSRKQAYDIIRKKLENNEELYLRGNIIGLQRNGGRNESKMAAYVNIEGLGIIGVIPIKKWSVGYVATQIFRDTINKNTNAIVNFKVCNETSVRLSKSLRTAFICSRADYLEKSGYNPWQIIEKTLKLGSVVKVKVIEPGISRNSYFAALDGLVDFNALCFIDGNSQLRVGEIEYGRYYYGYVQKMEREHGYLRVRLTNLAEQGSNIKKDGIALYTHDE